MVVIEAGAVDEVELFVGDVAAEKSLDAVADGDDAVLGDFASDDGNAQFILIEGDDSSRVSEGTDLQSVPREDVRTRRRECADDRSACQT